MLKKGGTFAIHDIFSKSRYGDMRAFVKKLMDMGYEKVELIDSTGRFFTKWESVWMDLAGSALLTGKKRSNERCLRRIHRPDQIRKDLYAFGTADRF